MKWGILSFWWMKRRLVSSAVTPLGLMTQIAGGAVGVSVFMADKADGEVGSEIPAENTYLGTRWESALPRMSPISLAECFGAWADTSDWYRPKKVYPFNQNQFPTLTLRYGENECWANERASLGQLHGRQSNLKFFFFFCDCIVIWLASRPEARRCSFTTCPLQRLRLALLFSTGPDGEVGGLFIVRELCNMPGCWWPTVY